MQTRALRCLICLFLHDNGWMEEYQDLFLSIGYSVAADQRVLAILARKRNQRHECPLNAL